MKNLRIRAGGGREAVGTPVEMIGNGVIAGGKLLYGGRRENGGGTVSVFSSGSESVRVAHLYADGSRAIQRLTHGGKPSAVVGIADGIALTGAGAVPTLHKFDTATGRYVRTDYTVKRVPLSFAAEPMEVFSATAASVRLSDSYSERDSTLSEADARIVGKQMAQLYTDIADRAAAARLFIQPVMASYRLKDRAGRTLYQSAPVIAGLPEGVQATASSTARIATGGSSATGLTLSARGFRLKLVKSDEWETGLDAMTAEVEVVVSPQLHPLEASAACETRLVRAATNTLGLTAWLPGAPRDAHPAEAGSRLHRAVGLMLTERGTLAMAEAGRCRPDAVEELHPFDTQRNTYALQAKRLTTVLTAAERHIAALAASPSKATAARRLGKLTAPHAFGAVAGDSSGETVVWGGLRRIRFDGYSPVELATETKAETGAPTYEATVETPGGESVRIASPTERSLTAFSPLLVYPDGDATALTLSAGGTWRRFALTPTADGLSSYWLDPDLKAVETATFGTSEPMPGASGSTSGDDEEEDLSLVGLAEASDPTRLVAVTPTSAGEVTAVAAAPRASGGLEFGRNIFYVFGWGGIDMVRVSATRSTLTAMRLDPRGVGESRRVAVSATAVSALAGDDLITFSTSHKPLTVARHAGADALGYEESRGEYWCLSDSEEESAAAAATADKPVIGGGGADLGDISDPLLKPEPQPPLRVIESDGGSYYRDDLTVESMLTCGGGLIVADREGRLLDASRETWGGDSKEVEYETIRKLAGPCRPRIVRLDTGLTGREVEATVKVTPLPSATATPDPRNAMSVKTEGDLRHPYCVALAAPHAHALRIEIKATGKGIGIG